ncbi:OTU domain-containing protein 4 [Lamellibrachia satsuma]|nr:OTU domain-containing protein 4 [Lamellibrachia satsuma]
MEKTLTPVPGEDCVKDRIMPMEEYLATLGLWRKPIAKDGSCLFRAVSEQLFHTQVFHLKLREDCARYLDAHQQQFEAFVEGPFDQHVNNLQSPWEWAGQVEIAAMSLMYKCDFIVYQHVGKRPENITKNQFEKKVMLAFSDGKQYDSIYPNSYIESSAICQSILYELLYGRVFGLEQAVEQAENMVAHKPHKFRQDSSSSEMADSSTPEASVDSALADSGTVVSKEEKREGGHKGAPFPYKVARALSPNCYRNVEYDLWLDLKKDFDHYDLEEDPPLLVGAATIGHTPKCATLIGYQTAYYVTKEFPRLTPLLFFYASMCFRVIYVIYPEDN